MIIYVPSNPSLKLKKKNINVYQNLTEAQFINSIEYWCLNIL